MAPSFTHHADLTNQLAGAQLLEVIGELVELFRAGALSPDYLSRAGRFFGEMIGGSLRSLGLDFEAVVSQPEIYGSATRAHQFVFVAFCFEPFNWRPVDAEYRRDLLELARMAHRSELLAEARRLTAEARHIEELGKRRARYRKRRSATRE